MVRINIQINHVSLAVRVFFFFCNKNIYTSHLCKKIRKCEENKLIRVHFQHDEKDTVIF